MQKQDTTTKQAPAAPEATTTTTQDLPPITRETTREGIRAHAAFIGCDRKKAVSGMELLIIFIRELERQAVLPADYNRARAAQIASHFDANSSAMTKRLYESDGSGPVDRAAALAAMLSAPPAE